MADDVFEDWHDGDPPYTAGKVAANFRAIRAEFARLFSTNGRDAIVSLVQVGRALTFKTAAGVSLPGASLPLAPTDPKGDRIVGRWYDEGDLYRVNGSSYVVLVGHNATSDLVGDIAAGKVTLHAAKGDDAENYIGPYAPGQAYKARDVTYIGTPATGDVTWFRAFMDAPIGAAPPAFPWGVVASLARTPIEARFNGVFPAGKVLWRYPVAQSGYLPFALTGSRVILGTAPAAALTLSLRKNGVEVGTIAFAVGATEGVVATPGGQVSFSSATKDVLSIVAPASADAAAADLAATLMASLTS